MPPSAQWGTFALVAIAITLVLILLIGVNITDS